jgi:hypothetical protein
MPQPIFEDDETPQRGRVVITDPAVIEALTRSSEEAFAEVRRLMDGFRDAGIAMHAHPERYLTD